MKSHAHSIHPARGDVVDSDALVDALSVRTIAVAGLGVYPQRRRVAAHGEWHQRDGDATGGRVVTNVEAFLAGARRATIAWVRPRVETGAASEG
jgi:lactate dehydrogenase-like 2-hydroxyacid dehydrogenase